MWVTCPESAGETLVLLIRKRLTAEKHDETLEESLVDLPELAVAKRLAEVSTFDSWSPSKPNIS